MLNRVEYGTNDNSTFNRDGLTAPSRSATALQTSYVYADDGTVTTVQDPTVSVNRVDKYAYDAAGRLIKTIRHYDSSVNSGDPYGSDDNITTKYEYTDGLRTKVIRDLPSGETDQETVYAYGTTKGASGPNSKIATGHLLSKMTFPDSADSNDVVKFAYNAQGQQIWRKDQEPSGYTANAIESNYDALGRLLHRRVTTLGTGYDPVVRRITYGYTSRGRLEVARQYDNATIGSGSIINEVKRAYDDWDNVAMNAVDRNSAVGASGSVDDYRASYTYAKASSSGRNVIRLVGTSMAVGAASAYKSISYTYASSGSYDNDASRVTRVRDGTVDLAQYEHLGISSVVGDERPEAGVLAASHSLVTSSSYDGLDRFNRRIHDRWIKDLSPDVEFYSVDMAWDETSHLVSSQDNVFPGSDVLLARDDLSRITRSHVGTLGGGSISSPTRDEQWNLSQTSNWARKKLDLDGDGDFDDADEHDDSRVYNVANELTNRDLDSDTGTTPNNFTLLWNPAGKLVSDGQQYKFVYDALYRLRKITTLGDVLVEEFTYDGLGNLLGQRDDNDRSSGDGVPDGQVDGDDHWYYSSGPQGALVVSVFRDGDDKPKKLTISSPSTHQVGAGGLGGLTGRAKAPAAVWDCGEYVFLVGPAQGFTPQGTGREIRKRDRDSSGGRSVGSANGGIVCMERDTSSDWTDAADSTLDERSYYCQDARGSVVAVVSSDGEMKELRQYSGSGMPMGILAGDVNFDFSCDSSDVDAIENWGSSPYDVRADVDLDGEIDASDAAAASAQQGVLGWGALTSMRADVGLLGAEYDDNIGAGIWRLGRAIYSAELGLFLVMAGAAGEDEEGETYGEHLIKLLYANMVVVCEEMKEDIDDIKEAGDAIAWAALNPWEAWIELNQGWEDVKDAAPAVIEDAAEGLAEYGRAIKDGARKVVSDDPETSQEGGRILEELVIEPWFFAYIGARIPGYGGLPTRAGAGAGPPSITMVGGEIVDIGFPSATIPKYAWQGGRGLGGQAPQQVTPGTRLLLGQYVDDCAQVQPWQAWYDEYGRLVERTDFTDLPDPRTHTNPHHHTYEYGPGFGKKGKETRHAGPGPRTGGR